MKEEERGRGKKGIIVEESNVKALRTSRGMSRTHLRQIRDLRICVEEKEDASCGEIYESKRKV